MDIFGTRKYYPKGENLRRILKEILSFGLYNNKEQSIPNIDTPYNYSIGKKYASRIIKNTEINTRGNTDVIRITYSSVFADEAEEF